MKTNAAKWAIMAAALVSLCLAGCKTAQKASPEHPRKAAAANEHPTEHSAEHPAP